MRTILKQSLVFLGLALSLTQAEAAVPSKLAQFPEGERLVYTRLVEAYNKSQLAEVLKSRQTLERGYPNSIHLDNAYYFSGLLRFQGGQYAEALRDFDVVRDRYTKSNKRPAAIFAIARTYEQLNLKAQAHNAFETLRVEYPGSPEAQRAWMEMRLENKKKK